MMDAKQGGYSFTNPENDTIHLLAASKKQFPDNINIMNSESRALGRDSLDIASTHESWHQNWHQFIPSTESWAVC